MKKQLSALAVAALLASPAAFATTKLDIGGDVRVDAYTVDFKDTDQRNQAAANRIRLKLHFETADGIKIHTRWALTDRTFNGDNTGGHLGILPGQDYAPYGLQYADGGQYLDYGYVTVPIAGWDVSAGRRTSSWAFDLTSSDDRRDAIWASKRFGNHTLFGFWDKRSEGGDFGGEVTASGFGTGDREAWTVANVSVTNGWLWGVLIQYYTEENLAGKSDGLDGALVISPTAMGKIGPVQITTGAAIFAANGETAYDEGTPVSAFLRAGYDMGGIKLEAQYGGSRDGGLVSGGFDTFSSLLNNSPTNNRSPLSVYKALGAGNGAEDWSEDLLAVRVTGNVTDQVKLVGAAGWFRQDNDQSGAAKFDEDGFFLELQAHYQLAPSTTLSAVLAHGNFEDVIGSDVNALGVRLTTNF